MKYHFLLSVVIIGLLISGCASASSPVDEEPQVTQQPSTRNYGPANFEVTALVIDPRTPATGDMFSVLVTVSNSGGPGEYEAVLNIDEVVKRDFEFVVIGNKVFTQSQALGARQTATIEFSGLTLLEGTFILTVGEMEEYVEIGC